VKTNHKGIKMTENITHLSTLTLNVNGLDAPIKRHRKANWLRVKG
jgi:hypothetical protein